MDWFAVKVCALAFLGMKHLIGAGNIHHSHLHLVVVFQSHADGTLVDAAAIVGGTVDRVDYPRVFMLGVIDVLFLAQESRLRHYLQ